MGKFADSKFPRRLAEDGNVSIYIDHSNFRIQGQEAYADRHNVESSWYKNWLFDIRHLQKILTQHSGLLPEERDYNVQVNLYGPSDAAMESFWIGLNDNNVRVKKFDKSPWSKREKEVDTTIVADSVEEVTDAWHLETRSEFIIVSGDRDFQCIARKMIRRGYNVHIWSWENGLSSEYRKLEQEHKRRVVVHLLDDFLEEIGFKAPTSHLEHARFTEGSFVVPDWKANAEAVHGMVTNLSVPLYRQTLKRPGLSEENLVFTPAVKMKLEQLEGFFAAIKEQLATVWPPTMTYEEFRNRDKRYRKKVILVGGIAASETDSTSGSKDTDSMTDDDGDKENCNNDTDSNDKDTDSDDFTLVQHRRKMRNLNLKKPGEKTMRRCHWRKYCQRELECRYGHTEKEKEYFKTFGYKKANKIFQCKYGAICKDAATACDYAHSEAEFFCPTCEQTGHDMKKCHERIWA
ncbi:hypothetical protein NM208_g2725 [Fusarium decemcellulare]|uniref:Uncharacterized protein n=1 Tax=Fusarium decemcellulare TaxID=57161 RepID=A0ACC1SRH5_9HYPO|nr:hypothetical protein NM208_g2725 [Fusarium decemcellulare]